MQEICLKLILYYTKYYEYTHIISVCVYYCTFKFPTFDERHKKKFVFLKREKLNAKVQKMHIFVCFCSWERILTQDFIYGTLRVIEKKPHVAAAIRTDQCLNLKKSGLEVIFALLIAPLVKFIFFPRISSFFVRFKFTYFLTQKM